MSVYGLLADVVVLVHAAYIAVVVFGLLAILAGRLAGWRWTRNFWFRAVHLLMIGIVVVQALVGIQCPLTTWEYELRKAAHQEVDGSAVAQCVHPLIFYHGPVWAFAVGYSLFGALVVGSLFLVPPRRPWRAVVPPPSDPL